MKKILKIIPFILFCTACESDPELTPDQYPILITLDVTEIDSTGASFKAEIVNTNYIAITECGFVWRKDENPSLADYWCSVTPAILSGNYSKRISGGLVEGQRYCVRAYAKGVDFLVYGTDTWFESKGSLPVKIHDFHPDSCMLGGERFVIEGESFSTMPAENHVYFGSTRISVISSYPDSLIIMTPVVTKSEVVSVSVEVNGHTALCDKPLKMVYPWKRIGDFPGGALNNAVAFVIGDKAYVGSGETDSLSNAFWQHDPMEDNWIQVATFPGTGRLQARGGVLGDKGFITCGVTYGYPFNHSLYDCWVYDPATDAWTMKFDTPDSLTDFIDEIFGYGGKLYTYNGLYGTLWVCNEDSVWSRLADCPLEKNFAGHCIQLLTPVVIQDRILCSSDAVCWEYDPSMDQWEKLTDLNSPHTFDIGLAVNDRLVFLDVWSFTLTLFDPASNQCYALACMDWRRGMVIFATGNSIIFGLGDTNHLWEMKL